MSPSELTNTIEPLIVCFHRNEAHFIYIYVYHTNVSEADNIYKNPPPNVISPIFLLFLFRSGCMLYYADCIVLCSNGRVAKSYGRHG